VSKLSVTQNNLIVGDASNVGSLLAPGSNGQVLAVSGGAPTWTTLSTLETDPIWTAAESGNTTITGNWTFSNVITGDISGNAGTATALQTARNFSISGDVTASAVSFNGTADVVLNSTIANDAVTSAKIADGTIVDADISNTAGIAVSKLSVTQNNLIVGNASNVGSLLAPGSNGQVLAISGGAPAWTTLSTLETDPVWTAAKTTTPTTITPNWTFSGNLVANGNTTLGDASTDNVIINGTIMSDVNIGDASTAHTVTITNDGTVPGLTVYSNTSGGANAIEVYDGPIYVSSGSPSGEIILDPSGAAYFNQAAPGTNYVVIDAVSGTVTTSDYVKVGGDLIFDRTNDGTLTTASLTAIRTWTLPDADGEISVLGQTIGTSEIENGAVTTAKIANGSSNDVLLTNNAGNAVQWGKITASNMTAGNYSSVINTGTYLINISGNAATATTATNLAGGAAGSLPYQSAANTTTFLGIGSANTILTSNGSAPQWVSSLTDAQVADNLTINGGTITNTPIDNSVIGGTTPAAGTFTTLAATTITQNGNAVLDANTSFAATGSSDATVSGTYNALNIQLKSGVVTGVELEDLSPDPSGTYGNTTTVPVITVDENGRVTGVTTASISFPAETDPKVNMSTTNAVPKWNGTKLVDGSITDNGTTVSVGSNFSVTVANGNTTTNGNLTVNGNTTLGNSYTSDLVIVQAKVGTYDDSKPALEIVDNTSSTYNNYLLNIQGLTSSGTRAANFENSSSTYPAVNITNRGDGTALYIDNSIASNPGPAIEISDNGGIVKLSYESISVSGNTATISNNVSVVYITSDNDNSNDTVTLPSGTDGQFLYVVYIVNESGGATDNIILTDGSNTIYSNASTNGHSVRLTLVYAGGQWNVVSIVE
jgi:cytoskeletal protein CcmA (bactofilin family)